LGTAIGSLSEPTHLSSSHAPTGLLAPQDAGRAFGVAKVRAAISIGDTYLPDRATPANELAHWNARARVCADSRAALVESRAGLPRGLTLRHDRAQPVIATHSGAAIRIRGAKLTSRPAGRNDGAPQLTANVVAVARAAGRVIRATLASGKAGRPRAFAGTAISAGVAAAIQVGCARFPDHGARSGIGAGAGHARQSAAFDGESASLASDRAAACGAGRRSAADGLAAARATLRGCEAGLRELEAQACRPQTHPLLASGRAAL